ncbi:type II 3-dehydroquinate dehydratase [Pelagicoccus sp. SDUM812003]|uniref:type II 3-dehydroquinate dehydratase n=1 Tax=Pelagicoccus sp. SDUM812003 TaxID=3041267 RepID=UPI00280FE4D4|nr:type II 3-dehydroquinate dehydratase [Pelagicoccus sp. SDUM812003]MDQ8203757.1 type II 3-dehydroquinate dehydratase [Pelagicoccus sp. SDUM812003]
MKIAVLNGPNLNRLGKREPEIYGSKTLDDIAAELRSAIPEAEFEFYQSNHEGDLVDKFSELAESDCQGVIFNPAAYSHTSVALRDAISASGLTVIEVHISNIHSREQFRHHSFTAEVSKGVITGLGTDGYLLAARALL